jgi:hypothetical protein
MSEIDKTGLMNTESASTYDEKRLEEFITWYNSQPQITHQVKEMTSQQLLNEIIEHEKIHRGIDWIDAIKQGDAGIREAKQKLHAYIEERIASLNEAEREKALQLGIINENGSPVVTNNILLADPTPMPIPSSASPYPCWGWDSSKIPIYSGSQGNDIATAIQQLVRNFQVLENDSPEGVAAQLLEMGIWGFGLYGLSAVANVIKTLAELSEATEAGAVFLGVLDIGINVLRVLVASVILAILIPIVILVEKQACAVMVIINNTNYNMVLTDLYVEHGEVVGIFESEATNQPTQAQAYIPALFPIYNPNVQKTITMVSAGFFAAQKMNDALIGTVGAFQFAPTPDYPQGINIGWSIPLAIGSNSVLVDAQNTGNLENFANSTESQSLQSSTSTSSTGASVSANVNSDSGSVGYMIITINRHS